MDIVSNKRPIAKKGEKGFPSTHGMTKTKIHKIWSGMIERGLPNYKDAHRYYNRGIRVCERWKIFENFYEDMGNPPKGASIDRIDVNGDYCPENCRWASSKVQQNNRTNTRYLNVNGEKIPLMEFASKLGIKKSAAQYAFSFIKKMNDMGLKVSVWEN